MPVSTVLGGVHGLEDVALSVACVVGGAGAVAIEETPFAPEERRLLQASADAIRASADSLGL